MSLFMFYLFLEREREGEIEKKKHHCVVASCTPPTGDPASNPGMCPRLGTEPVSPWFKGRHSIHWDIPPRAMSLSINTTRNSSALLRKFCFWNDLGEKWVKFVSQCPNTFHWFHHVFLSEFSLSSLIKVLTNDNKNAPFCYIKVRSL